MTVYIIKLFGVYICCKSQTYKMVTTSTTKEYFIVLHKVCKDSLFICLINGFLGISIEYPVVVHVDNVCSIFLTNKSVVTQCTRDIFTSTMCK